MRRAFWDLMITGSWRVGIKEMPGGAAGRQIGRGSRSLSTTMTAPAPETKKTGGGDKWFTEAYGGSLRGTLRGVRLVILEGVCGSGKTSVLSRLARMGFPTVQIPFVPFTLNYLHSLTFPKCNPSSTSSSSSSAAPSSSPSSSSSSSSPSSSSSVGRSDYKKHREAHHDHPSLAADPQHLHRLFEENFERIVDNWEAEWHRQVEHALVHQELTLKQKQEQRAKEREKQQNSQEPKLLKDLLNNLIPKEDRDIIFALRYPPMSRARQYRSLFISPSSSLSSSSSSSSSSETTKNENHESEKKSFRFGSKHQLERGQFGIVHCRSDGIRMKERLGERLWWAERQEDLAEYHIRRALGEAELAEPEQPLDPYLDSLPFVLQHPHLPLFPIHSTDSKQAVAIILQLIGPQSLRS